MKSTSTKKVSLRSVKCETLQSNPMSHEVVSQFKNSLGQYVGKFVTSGIGLDEHKRRLKVISKESIK